jgi:hypothetical protein
MCAITVITVQKRSEFTVSLFVPENIFQIFEKIGPKMTFQQKWLKNLKKMRIMYEKWAF